MENHVSQKQIIYGIISIIVVFGLLFGVYQLVNKEPIYSEINQISSTDHLKWSNEKKNILVEYSDFQCPACKSFHELLKSFESSKSAEFAITKKITLIFRQFPLYQIHSNAYEPAYAAEAAGKQNKFYEMADLLYAKQDEWAKESDLQGYFLKLAEKLNLNLEEFKKDIKSEEIKKKVTQDLASGESAGINATPTFFLNGKKLTIESIDNFVAILKTIK